MSNERDQGYSALQRGDYETAITQLEAACQLDPNDFHAHLYLGGAYHQMKRPADAVRALMQAVALQPANAQARYNLAIAQEQAGNMEEALALLRNALALKPDYTQAQQALQRLSTPAPTQPTYSAPAQPPTYGTPTQQMPGTPQPSGYGAQPLNAGQPASAGPPPLYGAQPLNAPASGAQPLYGAQPLNAPVGAQPLYGAQPLNAADNQQTQYGAAPLYGGAPAPPAAGYGQQTQYGAPPAYGTPGYRPPAAYGQPQQGQAPPAYGQYPSTGYASNYSYQDSFSIGEAFQQVFQLLVSPRAFLAEQAGCEGMLAPLALLLAYTLIVGIGAIVMILSVGSRLGVAGFIAMFAIPVGLVVGYLFAILVYMLVAGVVHVISLLFGNRAPYSISFRAVICSIAPLMVISAILTLLTPLMITQTASAPPANNGYRIIAAQYNQDGSNPGMPRFGGGPRQFGGPGLGGPRQFGNPGFGGPRQFGNPGLGGGYNNGSYSNGTTLPTQSGGITYSPGMTALMMGLRLIALLWSMVLFGMALFHLHRLSIGGVVGVIVTCIALLVGIVLVLTFTIGTAIMGMAGSQH